MAPRAPPGADLARRLVHGGDADRVRAGVLARGASVVAAGEAEVGVAFAEAVTAQDVTDGGARADQRQGVRARLHGTGPPEPPAA